MRATFAPYFHLPSSSGEGWPWSPSRYASESPPILPMEGKTGAWSWPWPRAMRASMDAGTETEKAVEPPPRSVRTGLKDGRPASSRGAWCSRSASGASAGQETEDSVSTDAIAGFM